MKKLALAASVALLPTFAEAQSCLTLDQIHDAYTEQGLNTDMVFQSQVLDGRDMIIFATPEEPKMWQHFIEVAPSAECFRSLGRGTQADNTTIPFTNADAVTPAAPEHSL